MCTTDLRTCCLILCLALPCMVLGQWNKSVEDSLEIDRRMEVARGLGMEGRYIQATETLLQAMLEFDIDDSSQQGSDLHKMMGGELFRAKAYRLALDHFLLSFSRHPAFETSEWRFLNNSIAGAYMELEDWDNARRYFLQAVQLQRKGKDLTAISTTLNNLGVFYLEKGNLDSAQMYFLEAQASYARYPSGDSFFAGSVRDNLARVYKLRGDFPSALQLYERNCLTYRSAERKKHAKMQALNGVAEMQLRLGRADIALQHLDEARPLLRKSNSRFQEDLEAEWLRLRILLASMTRDFDAYQRYSMRQSAFQDSLKWRIQSDFNAMQQAQAHLVQRDFDKQKEIQELRYEKNRAEMVELEDSGRRFRVWAVLVALCLVLAGTLVYRWLHFRSESLKKQLEINAARHQLVEERLMQESLSKENLALKVSLREQDLTNFALDNQRKRDLLEHLSKQLKRLKPGQVTQARVSDLISEMLLQTQTESISRHYEENIDVVNAEFKSKLKQRFPKLSLLDIELCGMIRLGMQVKEIAAFRNVTENAILVSRKRLRKKLEIEAGKDLRMFLLEE